MDIRVDKSKFDALQHRLIGILTEEIIETLSNALDLKKESAVAAGCSVAFGVASILDGSRVRDSKDRHVIPHLAFSTSAGRDELVTAQGGSWMHEYVHACVSELYREFESPVILHAEIKKLPFRPLSALAFRALLRGKLVLSNVHKRALPQEPATMLDALIDLLEQTASASKEIDSPTDIIPAELFETFKTPLNDLKFSSPERCLFLAAQSASRVQWKSISTSLSFVASMTNLEGAAKEAKLKRIISTAAYLDFRRIQTESAARDSADQASISPAQLGKLWPNGEPNWSEYA